MNLGCHAIWPPRNPSNPTNTMFKKLVSSVRKSKQVKAVQEHLKARLLSKVPFLEGADDALISDLAAVLENEGTPVAKR